MSCFMKLYLSDANQWSCRRRCSTTRAAKTGRWLMIRDRLGSGVWALGWDARLRGLLIIKNANWLGWDWAAHCSPVSSLVSRLCLCLILLLPSKTNNIAVSCSAISVYNPEFEPIEVIISQLAEHKSTPTRPGGPGIIRQFRVTRGRENL